MTFGVKERGKTAIPHLCRNRNGEYKCVDMFGRSTGGAH